MTAERRLTRALLKPRISVPVRYGTVISVAPVAGTLVLRPSTAAATDGTQDVTARYLTHVAPVVGSVVRFDVVQGDVLVLGSATVDAYPAAPYAVAAGNAQVILSVAASGGVAVSFPTGRFAVAPIVVCSCVGTQLWNASAASVTNTGFTANVRHIDNTTATGTVNVQWHAIEMTSTSGAG